jgi:DNA mismatch repair ATPase MutS
LWSSNGAAHAQIGRLVAIMQAAEVWRSPMIYAPLQLILLWDFHLGYLLERWQQTAGREVARWLDALGAAEALAALATVAHDNPEWIFPELTDAGPAILETRALGHPLLAPDSRVANDVTVGPPGTFLLVTGSNMAGKSTLIRSIGLNVVLAQCGGPVCATFFRCPPLMVHTSIRVQDSLEQGVSFFMAELLRLKQVVTAADTAPASGRTLLYLLDEILQGTNSAERTVAARRIIGHLVASGAIGAVTTHDLALAAGAVLSRARTDVHFSEQLGSGANGASTMTFDYRLRPGVATSTNALKLLEIVGLPGAQADESPTG